MRPKSSAKNTQSVRSMSAGLLLFPVGDMRSKDLERKLTESIYGGGRDVAGCNLTWNKTMRGKFGLCVCL